MEQSRCKVCKILLSNNKDDNGYCPNLNHNQNALYCKKCFDLIHYNKIENQSQRIKIINHELNDLFSNNSKYEYFIIMDVFNLIKSNDEVINKISHLKNLNLVINKMDLIKDINLNFFEKLIINYLEKLKLNISNILFLSSKENLTLINLINELKNDNVFIGYTNAGKSSLIQKILSTKQINEPIIINNQLNTTLIKNIYHFDNINIIDTPGFIDNQNILNYIDHQYHKFIHLKNLKNIKTYQIKYNKTLSVENLIYLNVYVNKNQNGSINFYMNNLLNIESYNHLLNNYFNQSHKISYISKTNNQIMIFNFNKKQNYILIDGLGMIKLNNIKKIELYYQNELKIIHLN